MTPEDLAGKLFRLTRKFRDAYNKRMDNKGADEKAEELADIADTCDKAYSFITDAMATQRNESRLEAEKQVLSDELSSIRQRLDEWEQAYRYYSDIMVHNKLEEVDNFIQKRTGRQPENDGQRINAFKEILEKQPK